MSLTAANASWVFSPDSSAISCKELDPAAPCQSKTTALPLLWSPSDVQGRIHPTSVCSSTGEVSLSAAAPEEFL